MPFALRDHVLLRIRGLNEPLPGVVVATGPKGIATATASCDGAKAIEIVTADEKAYGPIQNGHKQELHGDKFAHMVDSETPPQP